MSLYHKIQHEFVTNIINATLERFTQDQLIQRPESSNAGRKRNLDGALMWHRQFVRFMGEDVNSGAYRDAILKRFDTVYDDPLRELKKLKQTAHQLKELRMEFKHNGRKVVLRGTHKSNLQWMQSGNVMIQTPRIELSSMVLCVYPTTTLCMLEAEGTKEVPAEISELITQYHDVFAVPTTLQPMRPCDHKIPLKEGTIPITSRPYRYPPTQKDAIEVMVKKLLDTSVIRDSQSPFSSPVVMVKKKDGTWRMCVDYKKLNNATIKDKFPIPIIEELIDEFPTIETHVQHLRIVLEALRQNTLYAKQSKCVFGTEKVEHLGHVITKDGVATDGSKIEAMQNWPKPTNVKQLKGFLGLTGYYRRFIKNYAIISQPLTQLLKKNGFGWNEQAQEEFLKLKQSMIEAPVLKLPNFNELFIIETDASHTGIGAILQQGGHLVAYYNPNRGHPGVQATIKRINGLCYWRKLRQQVKVFVVYCRVWTEISMDFIEGLPSSYGKTTIFVVVDRLDNVYKLHGLPKVIFSDRDKIFISLFWKELFKALQVSLHLSTAYHPQSDGQTKVVNRCLECYLRCMSSKKPKSWSKWVSLAEYWYNTTYHTSIKTTPYEVLYGQPPSNLIAYIQGQCLVDPVDMTLAAREAMIQLLQFHMERAQNTMKTIADAKRTDREFEVGQWVYLKLQPHRQVTVRLGKYNKLNPNFSCLSAKKFKGPIPNTTAILPQCNEEGEILSVPVEVLDQRLGKVGNSAQVYVLIRWSNETKDDATWELHSDIVKRFPEF
uniref:Reverse transcriptase n=1 Tax=Tanacetum cinerariifolium TaxID=118510 RepID=A0A6L2M035_TANCI|nr:reverse transcriptase [Tanacetum cinerariifolium]